MPFSGKGGITLYVHFVVQEPQNYRLLQIRLRLIIITRTYTNGCLIFVDLAGMVATLALVCRGPHPNVTRIVNQKEKSVVIDVLLKSFTTT